MLNVAAAIAPPLDAVELSKNLIRFKSINPNDEGAIDYVANILRHLGFQCSTIEFGDEKAKVKNLYARRGNARPNLCFSGHVDVVPAGDYTKWTYPPFAAEVHDGILYGRGAADMKSALCAYIAAVSSIAVGDENSFKGSLSFIVTSDEEGSNPEFGTRAVMEWLRKRREKIDFCLVGEATNSAELGDTVKIGRRGMIQFELKCFGKQGHAGYPELAENPIERMVDILRELKSIHFDNGNQYFQPSHLVVTSVDVRNEIRNIIPDTIKSYFTIRYNTEQSADSLIDTVQTICKRVTQKYELTAIPAGDAFIMQDMTHAETIRTIIHKLTGITPALSTGGGTSDARFIKNYSNVIEFGLINSTIHQVNECAKIDDIYKLVDIYKQFIANYFRSEQVKML